MTSVPGDTAHVCRERPCRVEGGDISRDREPARGHTQHRVWNVSNSLGAQDLNMSPIKPLFVFNIIRGRRNAEE